MPQSADLTADLTAAAQVPVEAQVQFPALHGCGIAMAGRYGCGLDWIPGLGNSV